jgi:flavin reductase (DIM6/NTAB) family NADH-FMN oxidoreductase RutF
MGWMNKLIRPDSALNILETKQFCVSIISEPLLEASHMTSMDLPPHLDEWKLSGLTKRESE